MKRKRNTYEGIHDLIKNKDKTLSDLAEHYGVNYGAMQQYIYRHGLKEYIKPVSMQEKLKKTKQTNLKKYGTENPQSLESIRSKRRKEKYNDLEQLVSNKDKTYNDLAEHYDISYASIVGLVGRRNLRDYIKPVCKKESTRKRKKTNLKRYGTENPQSLDFIKEKVKNTSIERYGVSNYAKTDEFIEKYKNAMLENYGVEHYAKTDTFRETLKAEKDKTIYDFIKDGDRTYDDIAKFYNISFKSARSLIKTRGLEDKVRKVSPEERLESCKRTCLERYGVENVMQLEETKKKVKNTLLKRYGVDSVMKIPNMANRIKEKGIKTKLERYGTIAQFKTKEGIENARKTLYDNGYRVKRGWKKVDEENIKLLLDKDLFIEKVEAYEKTPTVLQLINDYNLPLRSTYNFISNNELQHLFDMSQYATSYAEGTVYTFILDLGIGENDIIRNDRDLIKPLEVDFYLPKYNLAIEFNGTYWHSSKFAPNKYHQEKSLQAESKGVLLYHIFEYDWNNPTKQEIIKSQIRNLLKLNEVKIYARQCEIRDVDYKEAKDFINKNHLQGDGNLNKQINYGLYYNGELVYIMTFGKWRRGFKGKLDYEIFRSCSKLNTTVIGGASKLFNHFIKNYPEARIGTYSSIQSGDGSLYENLGFEFSHITVPTSVKVSNSGDVYTLFSKAYKESELFELENDLILMEVYGAGNKLWLYNV